MRIRNCTQVNNNYYLLAFKINPYLFTTFLLLSILSSVSLSGQNPGCVNTDLTAWYKADVGVTGTANISNWADQSGNSFHLTPRSSSKQPALTGVMNFNPAILFDKENLQITGTVLSSSSAGTVFGAGTNEGDSGYELFAGFGTDYPHLGKGSGANDFFFYSSNGFSAHSEDITPNQNQVYGWSWNTARTGIQVRLDGDADNFTKSSFNVGAGLAIGGTLNSGAEAWEGQIGEVLIYNRDLLSWEKEKIESYLAIKYGTTLAHNYYSGDWNGSSGTTIWTSGGGYDSDIAGIGRDDCQGLLQKQSKSVNSQDQPAFYIGNHTSSLPTLNGDNGSNFSVDRSFMVWGNNGLSEKYSTIYSPNSFTPTAGYYIMGAIWKVKETGTVGTVTVQAPKGAEHILVHNSATFTSGSPTEIALVDDGNGNKVGTVNLTDGQFFTFGRSAFAPGCVAANLTAWYRSDVGVTGSLKATSWEDQSTNNYDLVQGSTAKQPDLSQQMNYNPALTFDGSNDRLEYLNPMLSSNSAGTVFGAGTNDGSGYGYEGMVQFGAAQSPQLGVAAGKDPYLWTPSTSFRKHPDDIIDNQNQIYGWNWQNSGGATQVRLDGVVANLANGTFSVGNDFTIGQVSNNTDAWHGKIGEVIVYDRVLLDWEQEKIESYLAIKYGTTLPHNYYAGDWNGSTGTTIWTTGNGYDTDIAGIGQDNCQQLIQKQSKSVNAGSQPAFFIGNHTAGLPATNADNTTNFAGTGNFMVWGNNGLAKDYKDNYSPNSFVPAGGYYHMEAIWKVKETGTVGTVTIQGPTGAEHLLVHSSANFAIGSPTEIALVDDGNGNRLATVDLTDGQFFTFGRTAIAPGCVAANLKAWYKTDAGMAGTTGLSTWEDRAGNHDLTQSNSSYRPSVTGEMNFNPALSFDGSNDHMKYATSIIPLTSPASIFGAGLNNGTGGYENFAVFSVDNPHLGIRGSNNDFFMYLPGFATHSDPYINGQNQIYGWTWANGFGNAQVRLDGVIENFSSKNLLVGQSFSIGGYTTLESWTGLIGEIIIYDRDLTAWEKDKVETYLAIKFGSSLSHNYYAGDWNGSTGSTIYTTGTGYDNKITGIGRDDCQGLLQKQSRSAESDALITIGIENTIKASNAANTGNFDMDKEFILFGSNNDVGTFSSKTFTADECYVPETIEAVSDQRWKLQETGDVASARLELPISFFTNRVLTSLPIYLVYADDASLNTNKTAVMGTVDSVVNNIVYFDVDFPANSTVYFGFAGSYNYATCDACIGEPQYFNPGKEFGYSCFDAKKTSNTITGVTTTGGNADITADLSVTFPSSVKEFIDKCWPRQYGKWLQLIRYDNQTGSSGDVVYHTKLSKAAKPSFDIASMDYFIGQEDEVEIIGYCEGIAVPNAYTTSLLYPSSNWYGSTYGTVDPTANGGDARSNHIFYASPYWKYGTLHVDFTEAVDEVEVRWRQKSRKYNFKYFQYLYIGPMTLECPYLPAPTCGQADEMYVNLQFDQEAYSTCDTATVHMKLINRGCGTQSIDLENTLPNTGMKYVIGSLNPDALTAAGGSIGAVNAYGDQNTLTIQNINVPLGEYSLPIQIYSTAAVDSASIQATFQVDTGDDGVSNCGNADGTVISFYEEPEAYIPEISLAASDTCYESASEISYTLTFNNSSGSPAYPINLSMLVGNEFTVKKGSVVYSNTSLISNGDFRSNALDEEGLLELSNLTIPTGTSTIDLVANANSSRDEAAVRVEVVGDLTSTCGLTSDTKMDSLTLSFECAPIPAVGDIDCSKTQIITAPVVGQVGQKTLLVTVAVTEPGCFSPISVTGSGMSIANELEMVCTEISGIQQFSIPLFYDGSTLETMNFTIGGAGSCSADLTLPPKKVITDIWTLDCLPVLGPSLR